MSQRLRKIVSIEASSGVAYVEDGEGGVEPMQLVVSPSRQLGVTPISQDGADHQAIDQVGPQPAFTPPALYELDQM
jgi:hypothetical protein